MVNCLSCFIFVIEMVTITVTKVVKKTENKRTNLTFLPYEEDNGIMRTQEKRCILNA